LYKNYISTELL